MYQCWRLPPPYFNMPDQAINTGGDAFSKLLESNKSYYFINGKFDERGIQVLGWQEKIREL